MMMAVHEMPGVLSYPRTGKRGVPQQFPRRLYTMLESESSCPSDPPLIQWSHSGQAFRIVDIEQFSTDVLPKYFRTSKFSSFQRNLNLYGFSKVRKGPDTDMYAHPSFLRGRPELLSQLKKCKHGAEKKQKGLVPRNSSSSSSSSNKPIVAAAAASTSNSPKSPKGGEVVAATSLNNSRVVSPCHSTTYYQGTPPSSTESLVSASSSQSHQILMSSHSHGNCNLPFQVFREDPISPRSSSSSMVGENGEQTIVDLKRFERNFSNTNNNSGTFIQAKVENSNATRNMRTQGKLGLLALAMECLADHDSTV